MTRDQFIKEVELTYLGLCNSVISNAVTPDALLNLAIEAVKEEISTIKATPPLLKHDYGIGTFKGFTKVDGGSEG